MVCTSHTEIISPEKTSRKAEKLLLYPFLWGAISGCRYSSRLWRDSNMRSIRGAGNAKEFSQFKQASLS
jgi:hypothetical protein